MRGFRAFSVQRPWRVGRVLIAGWDAACLPRPRAWSLAASEPMNRARLRRCCAEGRGSGPSSGGDSFLVPMWSYRFFRKQRFTFWRCYGAPGKIFQREFFLRARNEYRVRIEMGNRGETVDAIQWHWLALRRTNLLPTAQPSINGESQFHESIACNRPPMSSEAAPQTTGRV